MSFDLKTAREHYELLTMQKNHQIYMQEFEKQLRSREKSIEDQIIDCSDTESAQESGKSVEPDTTIESQVVNLKREQRRFRESDKVFWETYNNCLAKLLDVLGTNSEEKYLALMKDLKSTNISSQRDHLKRSLLHIAVELQNDVYAKFLVDIGLNVNEKEGCGLTPLNLAVIKKDEGTCRYLVESGAKFDGPLYTSIASPLQMADMLGLQKIKEIFLEEKSLSDEEDELIRELDGTYRSGRVNTETDKVNYDKVIRSSKGFVTPLVDVGTCKTNCAVTSRSAGFKWLGPVPGDLHNRGCHAFSPSC